MNAIAMACIGVFSLACACWTLHLRVASLEARLHALENPPPAVIDACPVHGWVLPCGICDMAKRIERKGTIHWTPCDLAGATTTPTAAP